MKFVIVAVIMTLASLPGHTQLKGFSIGPFAEVASPTGRFRQSNNMGYGGGIGADIKLGKIGLTGSAGYMHFGGQTVSNEGAMTKMPAVNAFPVRAGIKYRIVPAFYAKLETGMAKFTGGRESAVIVSPGLGVRILGVDIQGKYELWTNDQTYGFWGLKAGINF